MPATSAATGGRTIATTLLLFCVAACAPRTGANPPVVAPARTEEVHVADRLYFGRQVRGGGSVSEAEWAAFLREVVTPRFPDGLTVWRARGQWLDPRGRLVQEPVFVLEVFHGGGANTDASFRAIAAEYKRRFHQDAVLRITTPVRLDTF